MQAEADAKVPGEEIGSIEGAGVVAAGHDEMGHSAASHRHQEPLLRHEPLEPCGELRVGEGENRRAVATTHHDRRPARFRLDRQQPTRADVDVAAHLARGEGLEGRGTGRGDDRGGLDGRSGAGRSAGGGKRRGREEENAGSDHGNLRGQAEPYHRRLTPPHSRIGRFGCCVTFVIFMGQPQNFPATNGEQSS